MMIRAVALCLCLASPLFAAERAVPVGDGLTAAIAGAEELGKGVPEALLVKVETEMKAGTPAEAAIDKLKADTATNVEKAAILGVLDADVRRVLVRLLQRRFLLAERSRDDWKVLLDHQQVIESRLHDLFVACEAMTPGEFKALGGGWESPSNQEKSRY